MMNMICVGLVGLCAVLSYKWVQAERNTSDFYDMYKETYDMCKETKELANKALDQRDELRAELKEAKEMIKLQEVTEEMMNNAIEHIYYMDRVLGENCEILESDWRNENYTTYVTEDEKYRYTLTESDIARVAIAMKYSDKENVYETICPIVEEILIEQFAKMRKEDMAKKVISLSEYRNRR